MQARVRFAAANVFALPLEFKREFDCVLVNPPFHGEGQASPDAGRARALMDDGALDRLVEAGLQAHDFRRHFHRHPARRPAERGAGGAAFDGRQRVAALAQGGRARQRVILSRCARVPGAAFRLLPGLILHDEFRGLHPETRMRFCGAEPRLPWGYPVCRFRPIPEIAESWPRPTKAKTFQDLILTLQNFWASKGCLILQPYDNEMGAGTFHPATTLRALGPKPWKAAYVQPSRRPKDGRYGENPNRLQHYYQFQVILKPAPENVQELYLESIKAIGLDPALHDIRFVEDDWESPTLGAWGLGWEVWCDGMEITQFTYFQQVGGIDCDPVCGEITYGLERLAMYVQNVEFVYDLAFNEQFRYGEVFHQNEQEFSAYNFERADTEILFQHFKDAEKQCQELAGWQKAGAAGL